MCVQLQVQVCKKQLEEDLLSDRHDSQWRTLSRSGALLSSLAHYTQCVQMTSCAMNRVREAAANLVHTDLNVSDKLQKMFKLQKQGGGTKPRENAQAYNSQFGQWQARFPDYD
uniref:Uncharacterized protein n=1 Tax=Timema cristinae TaxID=61476 RepID=A0A7R9D4T7_TIMCR|nr:unnamed protein product [Timema cristinae]